LGEAVFPCDPSTHPGIFGANVEPNVEGDAGLSIVVHGKDLNESFDVGTVKVAADAASVEKPAEPKEETIAFSKEQQWALDFGTELAAEQSLRDNLRVAAETLPRTGGEAAVVAPAAGRLIVEKIFPVGTTIEVGMELASILPLAGPTTDLASLQLAETEAKVSLEQAQRDRARAERLLAAGAVPARRAEEARAVEATAQARVQAAQTRLVQFDATRSGDGTEAGVKRFVVRAPISGILAESSAISGANTEVGKVLFRIVDINAIFVSGVVPESEFARLRQLSGAEIEMPDGQIRAAGRLVAVGRLVDPETRTVPVTYEVDNRDHRLAINQTVFLRLFLTPMGKAPVVPEAAIIDDAGRPVVFVQRGGETFLRRPVKLGIRNHGMVQVLDGVNVGDRVVTKGAYLIRLSTMSSAVPAHGHVH
jgi:RND family efflux transporter MFP subunit